MASVSASSLVIFIAALSIAAGVSGVMVDSVQDISQSISTHGEAVETQLDTDITIISDAGSGAIYDGTNETVSVLVKNTGERRLPAESDHIDALFDGQYVSSTEFSVTVVSNADGLWRATDVVRIELQLDGPLDSGEHRVVVIVDGDREVLRFYV
jgi:flagellar protein FlaG